MQKFPSNRRLIVALFMLVIAACYSIGLSAQRISERNVNVIAGKSTLIDFIAHPDLDSVKKVTLTSPDFDVEIVNGTGYGTVTINPTHTFSGTRQATVEYILNVNGVLKSNYRIYNIYFTNSIVKVNDDVVKWDGQGILNIDVKANDIYSYSGATLRINQFSGNASVNNGMITYSNPSFTGPDYVHYTLTDSLGTSDHGVIKIEPEVEAPTNNVEYKFTLNYLATKSISLPANFVKIQDPFQGQLTQTSGVGHYVYKPYEVTGMDTFKFQYNGVTITYVAKIIDVQKDPGLIKNDVVYVAENSTVNFDVYKNDLIQNLEIDTFSPQLSHDTLGLFSYNAGGKSTKNFFYKTTTAIGQETGKIKIVVDNFVPNQDVPYVFEVLKNKSLTLEYNLPIDGYTFTLDPSQSPKNATVTIAYDSLALSCGTSYGKAIINFTPDNNFLQPQEFVVNYCVNGGQCTPIKIKVIIIDQESSGCPCIDNCVYKGDLNNDGRVDKDDLLILGRYLGYSGPQRASLGVSANIGESSEEWQTTSVYDTNLKHADSNGDGVLTVDDANAIYDNFGKINKFVQKEQLSSKDYDLQLILEPAEADSGDLVIIYYKLGSNTKPVNDIFGISYGTSFDWGDSSSVVNEFYNNSWFTDSSPNLSFFKQISDGIFRLALTRTSGSGISGNGAIGQMSVIVDEADGLKDNNEEFSIRTIIADEIILEDSEGNKYSLPDASTTIKINKKKKEHNFSPDKLIVFPNPSDNVFFLHFNGGNIIQDITLYNNLGNEVMNIKNVNSIETQIPAENLTSGIYWVKVKTDKGVVNKKVIKK